MITSVSNKKIKDIQKLKENKNIKKYEKYLIEGKHLVEEAMKASVVDEIVISEDFEECSLIDAFDGEVTKVANSVMKHLSDTITTQGSNFHIDCFDNVELVDLLGKMTDFSVFATSLKADKYIEQLNNITGNVAVIFGNEGAGVSEEILDKVNNLLKISMPGKAESLNVSIAAGIVMHYISSNLT